MTSPIYRNPLTRLLVGALSQRVTSQILIIFNYLLVDVNDCYPKDKNTSKFTKESDVSHSSK